jgi:hypothetical protein
VRQLEISSDGIFSHHARCAVCAQALDAREDIVFVFGEVCHSACVSYRRRAERRGAAPLEQLGHGHAGDGGT